MNKTRPKRKWKDKVVRGLISMKYNQQDPKPKQTWSSKHAFEFRETIKWAPFQWIHQSMRHKTSKKEKETNIKELKKK